MAERRTPTTGKVQAMINASAGGANVKSGKVSGSSGSVTFTTEFASIPEVVMTVQSDSALRDCLFKVKTVSTTGFEWVCDTNTTLSWIATNAGNN